MPDNADGQSKLRKGLRAWAWRVPSIVIWCKALGVPRIDALAVWVLILLVGAGFLVCWRLADSKWEALWWIAYPMYLTAFPVIAVAVVVGTTGSVLWETGKRSGQPVRATIPALLAAAGVCALPFAGTRSVAVPLVTVLGADVLVVLLGLAGWVVAPLPWSVQLAEAARRLAKWLFAQRGEDKDALPSDPGQARSALLKRARNRQTDHKMWADMAKAVAEFNGWRHIVILGFVRKFMFAIGLLGVLLGSIAYALMTSGLAAFGGLQPTETGTSYLSFLTLGLLSLTGAGTDLARPESAGAYVFVVAAALIGIGALVILVTAFSMLGSDTGDQLAERLRAELEHEVALVRLAAVDHWREGQKRSLLDPEIEGMLRTVLGNESVPERPDTEGSGSSGGL